MRLRQSVRDRPFERGAGALTGDHSLRGLGGARALLIRAFAALILALLAFPGAAAAQIDDAGAMSRFNGRMVSRIELIGLEREPPQLVRNQLRTKEGLPFDDQIISQDLQRINRLGRFMRVFPRVREEADGTLTVIYILEEAPIIEAVQVTGNKQLSDQELDTAVRQAGLVIGTPVDEFSLNRARRNIEDLYRTKGYYQVEVGIDQDELPDGIILFRIREGERVKVTRIRFDGNISFTDRRLRTQIRTKVQGIFRKGPLDNETLDADIAALMRFYRDQGYLDARADRVVTPSPNGREAIVTFLIDEGSRYTLRDVTLEGGAPDAPLLFSSEQVIGLMEIKPGDVYSSSAIRRSITAIRNAYHQLGYVDATVRSSEIRDVNAPRIELLLSIFEGERFMTGEVIVQGNDITRQNVIRREIQVRPERPLDSTALRDSRRRLTSTGIFRPPSPLEPDEGVNVTIQNEQAEYPGSRDVLVQIDEFNTGQINFGAAVSSDSGIIGTISVVQENFDIRDTPDSLGEFFTGRAFRGGGQQFDLTLAPGFELQTYSISITEPALFESDTSLTTALFFREREFDDHDEQRYGGRGRIGRRFGDRWAGGITIRYEVVELSDIDSDAPTDLFEVEDANTVIGIGFAGTRTTVPPAERLSPSRGARTEISVEQVTGDFDFTKLSFEHELWIPITEDFLERKSVLSLRTQVRYNPQEGEAPIYERYFLGGRSFRGFDFRGVSPRGVRADNGEPSDDPIGGDFSFFLGAEYLQPIWGNAQGRAILSGVVFVDSGTVREEFGLEEYRVSVGVGVRLLLPISPAPLAFDFGFPIKDEDDDEDQLFSFSIDLPF